MQHQRVYQTSVASYYFKLMEFQEWDQRPGSFQFSEVDFSTVALLTLRLVGTNQPCKQLALLDQSNAALRIPDDMALCSLAHQRHLLKLEAFTVTELPTATQYDIHYR